MGAVADAVGDVFESVGDVFEAVGDVVEDVVDFVGDVVETVGDVVQAVIDDPLPVLLSVAGSFAGIPPWVTMGAVTAARGDGQDERDTGGTEQNVTHDMTPCSLSLYSWHSSTGPTRGRADKFRL